MANRESSDRPATVALIGNPNTGKSSLFNALCGGQARVGNYPGVTVEHKTARMPLACSTFKSIELVDLPGTYSLSARSADEAVSVEVLCGEMPSVPKPDAVIVILDATNLERNLYLLSQVLELQIPTLVALNMWDRLEKEGIKLDAQKLSESLGVRVVCTSASKRLGIGEVQSALLEILEKAPVSAKVPGSEKAYSTDPQGVLERSALASASFPKAFLESVDELEAWFRAQG